MRPAPDQQLRPAARRPSGPALHRFARPWPVAEPSRADLCPDVTDHQEELISRQPGYAHIDDFLGPFPAHIYNQKGPGSADFPRWVLPFLAAQVAEDAQTCPETTTVDLLPNGQVVERAPVAFIAEGWEDRVVDPNPDGTYSVGEDWWWYTMSARSALLSHLRALARPGTRHRRYRAMVAAHAAATMAADALASVREQLASRRAGR